MADPRPDPTPTPRARPGQVSELACGHHLVRCPTCGQRVFMAGENRLVHATIAPHEAPVELDASGKPTAWRPCPARGRPVLFRYLGGGQFSAEAA